MSILLKAVYPKYCPLGTCGGILCFFVLMFDIFVLLFLDGIAGFPQMLEVYSKTTRFK